MSYYSKNNKKTKNACDFSDDKDDCYEELSTKLRNEEFINLDIPEKAEYLLHNVFKLQNFRTPEQREAIYNAMKRCRDTYICFPTGAGKSLCYQLPALAKNGVTIVFSPLISLMEDQVKYLRSINIKCCTWNSTLDDLERSKITKDLMGEKLPENRIVYVSPESVNNKFFCKIIKKLNMMNRLNFFVVDEAHCISYWGHEFRSDYLKLSIMRTLCWTIPWIILTATANTETEHSIIRSLKCDTTLNGIKIFKTTPWRKNLFYDVFFEEVFEKGITLEKHILEYIKMITRIFKKKEGQNFKNVSGIVYCRTVKNCGKMAEFLTYNGISSAAYHSQLPSDNKKTIQEEWMKNKIHVVCATIAFGMGINKADVKFIIHHFPPDNLASYYQESGRAGRNGEQSFCRLYYSQKIKRKMKIFLNEKLKIIEDDVNSNEIKETRKKVAINDYEKVIEYCESVKCRNQTLCSYFEPSKNIICENQCDACKQRMILMQRLNIFKNNISKVGKNIVPKSTLKRHISESDMSISSDDENYNPKIKRSCSSIDNSQ
uniref:ATP-dependent DNA helicase n=1 Tax=Strongyloides stercoralis TaxID=6248 RepID=A0A0K0E9E2_STRER